MILFSPSSICGGGYKLTVKGLCVRIDESMMFGGKMIEGNTFFRVYDRQCDVDNKVKAWKEKYPNFTEISS